MSAVKVCVEESRIALVSEVPHGVNCSFLLTVQDVFVTETMRNTEYRVNQVAKISCKNITEVEKYLELFGSLWVTADNYNQAMEIILFDSWRYSE